MAVIKDVLLGDVCDFANGGTPSRSSPQYFRGNTPWVTSAHVDDDGVITPREFITSEAIAESATNLIPSGNVLLVSRTGVGKVAITRFDVCISQDFTAIKPDRTVLNSEFLYYFLKSRQPYFVAMQRGATIQGITRDAIESLHLSLPSVEEQKRIAARLAKADRIRRLRRAALDQSETLLQSAFANLLNRWDSQKQSFVDMGSLVKITGGGTPSRDKPEYFVGSIPWLTSKDMRGEYIFDTEEHISERAIKESSTNLVPAGSILVVVKSKVLMRRLPLAISMVDMCHGQDVKSIQCSNKVLPEFLLFVIKSNERNLLAQARGANTEGLTLPMLQEIPVPLISIKEQQHFANVVRRHEHIRAQQLEGLRQAEHLFQSLLHQAFGEGVAQ